MGNATSLQALQAAAGGASAHHVHPSPATVAPSDGFFIISAARAGDLELLKLFLAKNASLAWAVSSHDKTTPWHSAASEGHLAALQLLAGVAKQGAMSNTFDPLTKAVNQTDAQGATPLMLACRGGHFACCQLLLELGSELGCLDSQGLTCLHHAALAPHGGCVQLLLKQAGMWGPKGPAPPEDPKILAFVDMGDAMYGRTPLHLAAWSGQLDGAVALLAAGANLLAKTTADCYDSRLPCNSGTTPLHMAAMRGHQHVAVMIMAAWVKALQRGAAYPDPRTQQDSYGNNPHKMATSRKFDAPLLLELLNPDTVIRDLQRLERRRQRHAAKQLETAKAEGLPTLPKTASGREGDEAQKPPLPSSKSGVERSNSSAVRQAIQRIESRKGSTGGGSGSGGGGTVTEEGGPALRVASAPTAAQPAPGALAAGETEQAHVGTTGTSAGVETDSRAGTRRSSADGLRTGRASFSGPVQSIQERQAEGQNDGECASSSDDDQVGDDGDSSSDESTSEDSSTPGSEAPGSISLRQLKRLVSVYNTACKALANGAPVELGLGLPLPPAHAHMSGRAGSGVSESSSGPAALGARHSAPGPAMNGKAGGRQKRSSVLPTSVSGEPVQPPSQRHKDLAEKPVPDFYLCPLTCRIYKDPVVAADGYSYERTAIERHIQSGSLVSPCNKKKLTSTALYPNNTLKSAVDFWKATNKYSEDM